MSKDKQTNDSVVEEKSISILFWMFAIFVSSLPCINIIFILLFAFIGKNRSRKNYFRALIAWAVIGAIFYGILIAAGVLPVFLKELTDYLNTLSLKTK